MNHILRTAVDHDRLKECEAWAALFAHSLQSAEVGAKVMSTFWTPSNDWHYVVRQPRFEDGAPVSELVVATGFGFKSQAEADAAGRVAMRQGSPS